MYACDQRPLLLLRAIYFLEPFVFSSGRLCRFPMESSKRHRSSLLASPGFTRSGGASSCLSTILSSYLRNCVAVLTFLQTSAVFTLIGEEMTSSHAVSLAIKGDWRNDERHGRGVMTSGAKDFLYDGEWQRNKRTGHGNCVIRGRETYSGDWKDGEFHGRGVHCDTKGDVYNGEVR